MLRPAPTSLMIGAWLCVALSGCAKQAPWTSPDPRDSFKTFLMDWTVGREEQVLARLSPQDRAVLERARQSAIASLGQAHAPTLSALFMASGVARPFDLKRVELASPLPQAVVAGTRSELKLTFHDGRSGQAVMVWDGERWCVSLGLEASPSAQPGA